MDRAATVAQYLNLVLFGALAAVCVRLARRHRTSTARWAAVSFGVIGAISAIAVVLPEDGGIVFEIFLRILVLALLGCPYALYRFSATFEKLPRPVDRVANISVLAVAVATVALPHFPTQDEAQPVWFRLFTVAFLGEWFFLSFIVARRLWRGGYEQSSVARWRMRTLAGGAFGLAIAALPGIVPQDQQPAAVRAVALALPSLTAVLFYLGLSPPSWLRSLWRRPEESAARRVELELVQADDRERALASVLSRAAALVGGHSATFVEGGAVDPAVDVDGALRIATKHGVLVVDTSPYAPFFGEDEADTLRSLAVFLDLVLDRIALHELERQARLDAERSSKELETLVYGISHDLKSPVISLLGYLEYLRVDHGATIGTDGQHFLDRMERAATYMQDLLGDLLELSRVGRTSTEVEDVDLQAVVEDISLDVERRFEGARVEVSDLPTVEMNPARARQLFTNLIENATRHGGREDITVRVFSAIRDDGSAVVSVVDDGVGIPAEYREKAFAIFERLAPRDSASGTGIGLALCRKIVEGLGGTIEMIDASVGTHVRMLFPVRVVRASRLSPVEVS